MAQSILVAEEDEAVRRMVARVLETEGYLVLLAGSDDEALSLFRTQRPDLVVMDLKVPDQSGWTAFEEIRGVEPRVPVVVITAYANQSEEAMRRGSDALMEKPLDLPLLLEIIKARLARLSDDAGVPKKPRRTLARATS